MADSKVSALTECTAIGTDDIFLIDDSGTSKKVTFATILAALYDTAITLPAADHTGVGIISSEAVGETVAIGNLLYLKSDGEWYKADADAATTMPGMRIALEAKNDGEACKMLVYGWFRDDSFNWTVGGLVYASCTAGEMTQTAPSGTGDQVQGVGVAYHADKMFFCPSPVTAEVK